jgi:hypothetical protein
VKEFSEQNSFQQEILSILSFIPNEYFCKIKFGADKRKKKKV